MLFQHVHTGCKDQIRTVGIPSLSFPDVWSPQALPFQLSINYNKLFP